MEKKCFNCENIVICIAYQKVTEMAGILNNVMRENPIGENGYTVMVNALAHDCTHYKKFKERN